MLCLFFILVLENTAKRVNLIIYFKKDVNVCYDQPLAKSKNTERHRAVYPWLRLH